MGKRSLSDTKTTGAPQRLKVDVPTLKLIQAAAAIRMTHREAAMKFGVALSSFEEFLQIPAVRAAWDKGEANCHESLRSAQFKLAMKNAQMSIHLGKIYLGQKDEIHVSGHVTLEALVLEAVKKRGTVVAPETEPE